MIYSVNLIIRFPVGVLNSLYTKHNYNQSYFRKSKAEGTKRRSVINVGQDWRTNIYTFFFLSLSIVMCLRKARRFSFLSSIRII